MAIDFSPTRNSARAIEAEIRESERVFHELSGQVQFITSHPEWAKGASPELLVELLVDLRDAASLLAGHQARLIATLTTPRAPAGATMEDVARAAAEFEKATGRKASQADIARHLGISQSRVSQLKRGTNR